MIPTNYVVFDIETTGFTPDSAEIIEIGALKCTDKKIKRIFHSFICPDSGYIPRQITALTGITYEMVQNSPGFADVLPAFVDFVGELPVVGHNVQFDLRFVKSYCRACSADFQPTQVVDTVTLARRNIKDAPNHKLSTLKDYLGIELPSHNAVDDCKTTYALLEYCRKKEAEHC